MNMDERKILIEKMTNDLIIQKNKNLLIISRANEVPMFIESAINKKVKSIILNFHGNDMIEFGIRNKIKMRYSKQIDIKIMDIEEIEKENMKFDYIIGNPPYDNSCSNDKSNKLYITITEKSIKLLNENGVIGFITPRTLAKSKKHNFFKNLISIDYSSDRYFNVGVEIMSWIMKPGYVEKVEITNDDDSIEIRKQNDFFEKRDKLVFNLIKKTQNIKAKRFFDRERIKYSTEKNGFKVYTNYNKREISGITYTIYEPPHNKLKKIVLSKSMAQKRENVIISKENFGHLQVHKNVENYTYDQIGNCIDYITNPLIIKICNLYKIHKNTGFNGLLDFLIDINPDKNYSDSDIIKLYNLKQEDIEYLNEI